MKRNHLLVVLMAAVFALVGVLLYRFQPHGDLLSDGFWGVISFASLGASFGCVVSEPGTFLDRRR